MAINFKRTSSNQIFDGKMLKLFVDMIEYDSGETGRREYVRHPGGAVVVPVTAEKKILLVSQHRYPTGKDLLELPAGKLNYGEDPELCAMRELEEETGWKTDKLMKLGTMYTTPGYSDELLHIYFTDRLVPGMLGREPGEETMQLHEMTLAEIDAAIVSGDITDSKTIVGIQMMRSRGISFSEAAQD